MLEFIVCDNNKNIVSKVSNIIDSLMMKNNTNYKIRKFYDYDDEFIVDPNNTLVQINTAKELVKLVEQYLNEKTNNM